MLKILGIAFLSLVTLGASAVVGGGVYVASGGIANVEIETPEVSFTVPVPMRLANLGLAIAEGSMPREELEQLRAEAGEYAPFIEAALEAVSEVPDGTVLVEVETLEETVYIAREDGELVIDVDAPDAKVHMKVPMRSIRILAESLGDFLGG